MAVITPDPAATEWVPLWDLNGSTSAGGGGPHHLTHEPGGTDPLAVDAAAATGSLRTLGSGANQAAPGNDTRFTNARPPTAHHTTHEVGGSDALVNAAWTNRSNAFVTPQTIGGASPKLALQDTSQPANAVYFQVWNTTQLFIVDATDDAGAVQARPLAANRIGDLTVGRNLIVSGTLQVTKQTVPRIVATNTQAAIQPNMDAWDAVVVNQLAQTLSILTPTGVLYDTAALLIRIRDNGTAQALVWDAIYFSGGPSIPTVTSPLKTLHLGFRYNSFYGKWMLIAKSQEP